MLRPVDWQIVTDVSEECCASESRNQLTSQKRRNIIKTWVSINTAKITSNAETWQEFPTNSHNYRVTLSEFHMYNTNCLLLRFLLRSRYGQYWNYVFWTSNNFYVWIRSNLTKYYNENNVDSRDSFKWRKEWQSPEAVFISENATPFHLQLSSHPLNEDTSISRPPLLLQSSCRFVEHSPPNHHPVQPDHNNSP